MVTERPTTAEAVSKQLLQFEIEKTHKSLFETGKSLGTAFLTYLSLVALTALLVYGRVEDTVEVPLLSVKVNKDLAAAITILLCQVVQIWVISLMVLRSSLTDLLSDQLKERFDRGSLESWYLQYPSPFHSIQFLINGLPDKPSAFISWLLSLAYSLIVAFLPIFLSYVIVRNAQFPASLKYPWLVTNTILNFSVMIGISRASLRIYYAEKRVQTRTRLFSELTRLDERTKEVNEQLRRGQELREEIQKLQEKSSANETKIRGMTRPPRGDVKRH